MSIEITKISKAHRTALVVDGEAFDSNKEYAERTNRLLQSLNGSRIKTDVFVRRGNTVTQTSISTIESANGLVAKPTLDQVAEAMKAQGYAQVLVSAAR